jgi:hypothetical protein
MLYVFNWTFLGNLGCFHETFFHAREMLRWRHGFFAIAEHASRRCKQVALGQLQMTWQT